MPTKRLKGGFSDSSNYSLSDDDIRNLCRGRINIVSNTDLHRYHSINQVLGRHNACALLYESKPNTGHWICITRSRHQPNIISVFDSYGKYKPDQELTEIDPQFRQRSNQNYPYLKKLLYDSGADVEWNNYPLQKKGGNVATCGRYAVMRTLCKDMPLHDFVKMMRSGKYGRTPDEAVTNLTNSLMNN
jgi:hypothetical protein